MNISVLWMRRRETETEKGQVGRRKGGKRTKKKQEKDTKNIPPVKKSFVLLLSRSPMNRICILSPLEWIKHDDNEMRSTFSPSNKMSIKSHFTIVSVYCRSIVQETTSKMPQLLYIISMAVHVAPYWKEKKNRKKNWDENKKANITMPHFGTRWELASKLTIKLVRAFDVMCMRVFFF